MHLSWLASDTKWMIFSNKSFLISSLDLFAYMRHPILLNNRECQKGNDKYMLQKASCTPLLMYFAYHNALADHLREWVISGPSITFERELWEPVNNSYCMPFCYPAFQEEFCHAITFTVLITEFLLDFLFFLHACFSACVFVHDFSFCKHSVDRGLV